MRFCYTILNVTMCETFDYLDSIFTIEICLLCTFLWQKSSMVSSQDMCRLLQVSAQIINQQSMSINCFAVLPESIKTLGHIARTGLHGGLCWKAQVSPRARERERMFTRDVALFFDSELQFINTVARRRLSDIINNCISP